MLAIKVKEFILENPSLSNSKSPQYFLQFLTLLCKSPSEAGATLDEFNDYIAKDFDVKMTLTTYLKNLFVDKDYTQLFSEYGLATNESLFNQISNIIWRKILPLHYTEANSIDLLNYLCSNTHLRETILESIPQQSIQRFLSLVLECPVANFDQKSNFKIQVCHAIEILSIKLNALGVESEIKDKFVQLKNLQSPFIEQYREICLYLKSTEKTEQDFNQIFLLLDQCLQYTGIKKPANATRPLVMKF